MRATLQCCACQHQWAPADRAARGRAQFGREKFTTQLERRRVCSALQGTLEMLGARQLVVGHTPQVPLP